MNSTKNSCAPKYYQSITLDELSKRTDLETYVLISGTDISLEIALLNEKTSKKENVEQLMELYFEYLVQGKKDGYSTQYLETQLKNITSLLGNFFKHASDATFRILSST